MDLYTRIKQRREFLKMSQDDLAKKMGYRDRSTIAKIEAGVNDITQSKIKAFAKALNTTPAYLMGWEDAGSQVNGVGSPDLTSADLSLIRAYHEATQDDKAVINMVLKKYMGKPQARITPIPTKDDTPVRILRTVAYQGGTKDFPLTSEQEKLADRAFAALDRDDDENDNY